MSDDLKNLFDMFGMTQPTEPVAPTKEMSIEELISNMKYNMQHVRPKQKGNS